MICRSKLFTGQTGCSLIGTTTLYRATATISLVVSEFTGSRYYARCRHHLIISLTAAAEVDCVTSLLILSALCAAPLKTPPTSTQHYIKLHTDTLTTAKHLVTHSTVQPQAARVVTLTVTRL